LLSTLQNMPGLRDKPLGIWSTCITFSLPLFITYYIFIFLCTLTVLVNAVWNTLPVALNLRILGTRSFFLLIGRDAVANMDPYPCHSQCDSLPISWDGERDTDAPAFTNPSPYFKPSFSSTYFKSTFPYTCHYMTM